MSRRLFAYLWAAPNTVLGLVAGLIMLCLGARVQVARGAMEFYGGLPGRALTMLPNRFCFGALTLGHVILGVSSDHLALLRAHEHVHVRQFEHWGPFFLPAYAVSSLWQVIRGRSGYRDNYFERQAYAIEKR